MSILRLSSPRLVLSFALEGSLTFGVLYVLAYLTLAVTPTLPHATFLGQVAGTSLLFLSCLYATRGSRMGEIADLRREVALASAISLLLAGAVIAVNWALSGSPQQLTALLMLEGALVVPSAAALWRWAAIRFNVLDGWRERVLVVGTGDSARQACRWIAENHAADYIVIGFADEDEVRMGQVLAMGVRILTRFADLVTFCPRRVDRVIVALEEKRGKLPIEELMELRLRGVQIEEATSFFERTSGKLAVETMLPSWLIFSDGFKTSRLRLVTKRWSDILCSVALLIIAAPAMALTAILIKLDSPGPILYRQKRMGMSGREFALLKFRSMVQDAESLSGPTWARENDPRVTRVGRVIRKLRIDELPQLFNVFKGQMSFVGPRPERRHFVHQLQWSIPYYKLRMAVRPGITGWAQVQYRYGATIDDAREKLKYDLYYIKNCDPVLDLWILLKTVKVVLLGSGAR